MGDVTRAELETDLEEIDQLLKHGNIKSSRVRAALTQLRTDTAEKLEGAPQTEEPELIVEEVPAGTRNVKQVETESKQDSSPTTAPAPVTSSAPALKYTPITVSVDMIVVIWFAQIRTYRL